MERTDRDQQLLAVVRKAIESFNREERYLIENNLSERCICARFVRYMEKSLEEHYIIDYDVDVEYNRGYDGKDQNAKKMDNKLIVVDLIVHKRGYDDKLGYDNLICIEMKKSYARRGIEADQERLRKLVDPDRKFRYQAGFMILIDADKKRNQYGMRIESEYYLSQFWTYRR